MLCQRLSPVSSWNQFRLLYELNSQMRITVFWFSLLQGEQHYFATFCTLIHYSFEAVHHPGCSFLGRLQFVYSPLKLPQNKNNASGEQSTVGHIHSFVLVSVSSTFTASWLSLDHNVFTVKISSKSSSYILPLLSHFFPILLFKLVFWSLEWSFTNCHFKL